LSDNRAQTSAHIARTRNCQCNWANTKHFRSPEPVLRRRHPERMRPDNKSGEHCGLAPPFGLGLGRLGALGHFCLPPSSRPSARPSEPTNLRPFAALQSKPARDRTQSGCNVVSMDGWMDILACAGIHVDAHTRQARHARVATRDIVSTSIGRCSTWPRQNV
jgi:hypothetical protein